MRQHLAVAGLVLGVALLALSACTSGPATTPGSAAATRLAGTPEAAASPAASPSPAVSPAVATAAAAASPAAATAVAAASPLATQVAALAVPVRIMGANWGPEDISLTVRNVGSSTVDLAGWRLQSGPAGVALPNDARIEPGESVMIHTAEGTTTRRDVYLGRAAAGLTESVRPGSTISLVSPLGFAVGQVVLPNAGS